MADLIRLAVLEADPAEVAQGAAPVVGAMARHAGAIEIGGALLIAMEAVPFAQLAPEGVVHVAEDHQGHGPTAADQGDRQGQVPVPPVTGGAFPVATADGAGTAAQARGAGMGQQHQRQFRIGRQGSAANPIGRLLLGHRPIDRAHRPRQGEATPSGPRPAAHHRQSGRRQLPQTPAAVKLPEQFQLLPEPLAAAVLAGVMVADDAGDRQLQLRQQIGDAAVAIAEITDKKQGIRPDQIQQQMV